MSGGIGRRKRTGHATRNREGRYKEGIISDRKNNNNNANVKHNACHKNSGLRIENYQYRFQKV